jgi:hypothetical protein
MPFFKKISSKRFAVLSRIFARVQDTENEAYSYHSVSFTVHLKEQKKSFCQTVFGKSA